MMREKCRRQRRRLLLSPAALLLLSATACGGRLRERVATRAALASPATTPMPPPAKSTPIPPVPTAVQTVPSIAIVQPSPAPASAQAPDLILLNGKVITVDGQDSIAQAVAIKGETIQAVGANEQIKALAGDQTQIIDLKGKAATPGLIDAHNHMQVVGMMKTVFVAFIPPEVKTMKDLQDKLAQVAANTPEGQWIQGYYLGVQEGRLPNRQDLDPASPKHPVWLVQQGGHYGSANSLALEMASINAGTPDPSGGLIERDGQGEPTGVFYNHRAMDVLRRHIPQQTIEMARDHIITSQPLFAACGVTSFHDNNVRGVDIVGAYMDAGKQGQMLLRGAVYYTLEWPQDLDRALREVERYQDKLVRFAGFKFLLDGQAQMAYCHQPHNGVRWDMPTWEEKSFKQAVRALHDTGLQICVHCIGDAAVDLTLDAYEEAMTANPRPDPRHRIEHCILCTPQASKRMGDLGVVVSTQPQFIRIGADHWTSIFGAERVKRCIVTREWLQAGVVVALGSDAPTTPWLTPQVTLAGAVGRPDNSGKPFQPEQCLSIQEALRAHTMGAAYAAHEEQSKGSIEVGKLADIAVWNDDPYALSVGQLWQATIAMTIVGGKVVYQV